MTPKTRRILGLLFGHTLFWGWNLLFLSLLFFGYLPVFLWEMAVATWFGMVPLAIALPAFALLGLPLPFMALAAWRLRSDPGRMLTLFYGIQAPLMVLCLVRIFAIGPLSAPTTLALALFTIASAGLLRTVLHGFEERAGWAQGLRQVAASLSLLVGAWAAVTFGIYAIGFVGWFAVGFVESMRYGGIGWSLEAFPFLAFMLATLAMMTLYPIAMTGISLRAWQVVHRATRARLGLGAAWGITLGTLAVALGAFAISSRQPQGKAFSLAEAALAPEATDADRRAAMEREEAVRIGLVAARTGPDRLFDADPEGTHIADMFSTWLPFGLESVPQRTWTFTMAPFLYDSWHDGWLSLPWRRGGGNVPTDVHEASVAYAALFDVPMDRAERDVLLASAHATWSWQDAQASLLDIGGQRVHLDRQTIDVEPHGDVAQVRIHDVYRSRTWQREEVLIAFHLPESAAVTGVHLGATDDVEMAFHHVLAPRGAAQEVYEAEVSRSVDPALLEQVGPRQYRLRAFPVLPREGDANDVHSITSEGPELHVWIDVTVPRVDDHYPLPTASEVRNLFWDDATERPTTDRWLPASVPAVAGARKRHHSHIGGWQVTATPAAAQPTAPGRTAVLIDGTRSMASQRTAVATALSELAAHGPVQVWCTREATIQRCDDFDPRSALFFGATPLEEQLRSWSPNADRRVVLTDAGSYELGLRETVTIAGDQPLWLVHLGGTFPSAYGDSVLDELQHTGGGAVGSVAELTARTDTTFLDGWVWTFAPSDAPPTDDPFTPLAARALVAHLDRSTTEHDLAFFDGVHAVAKAADVVTAYSSMLVLVNERQLQALADAEAQGDRFDREVIDKLEATPISAVPEPSTWLLIGLGALGIGVGRKRRGRISRTASA